MSKYRISFAATISRIIDVPNGLNWSEAYAFSKDILGWEEIAHSAAAKLEVNTAGTMQFQLVEE